MNADSMPATSLRPVSRTGLGPTVFRSRPCSSGKITESTSADTCRLLREPSTRTTPRLTKTCHFPGDRGLWHARRVGKLVHGPGTFGCQQERSEQPELVLTSQERQECRASFSHNMNILT